MDGPVKKINCGLVCVDAEIVIGSSRLRAPYVLGVTVTTTYASESNGEGQAGIGMEKQT